MEQPLVETIYGKSLRLNIPRLTCDQTNCVEQNIFLASRSSSAPPASEAVIRHTNNYILSMINCFVDFFIQYQTVDDEPIDTTDAVMQTLFELKKIIFSLCLSGEPSNYFQQFFAMFQDKYGACIMTIKNKFEIVQDVGVPDLTRKETFENKPTSFVWLKQKSTNLFLLGLSYKVLSLSGLHGIQIKDISDIIRAEKKRESGGKQSFILQFLPYDKEVKCFEKVDLFFLENMNSIIFQKVSRLAGVDGGSKCIKIKYNKSQKNKSRKFKYRKNTKKGIKYSQCSRRKRTQNKIL
jgi:hypothetical protein